MAMVVELTRRQEELVKLIQNKEKEIDDYKSQGVKTSRSKFSFVIFTFIGYQHTGWVPIQQVFSKPF